MWELGGSVHALGVVDVVLEEVPHYAQTVEFLLAFVEMEAEASARGLGRGAGFGRRLTEMLMFDVAYDKLRMNLVTADPELRANTLRLWLLLLPQRREQEAAGGGGYDLFALDPVRATLEVMLAVEEAPQDAIHGKTRILKLQQLQTAVEAGKVPRELKRLLLPFYIGQLRCRFTLPWKQVREGLETMAKHCPDYLWPGLLAHVSIASAKVSFSSLAPRSRPGACAAAPGEEEGGMDHKPAAGAEDGEEAEVEEDGEGGMEVEGKARQRKGKAAKRMSAAPRSVQVDLRVVPAPQRLREPTPPHAPAPGRPGR